MSKIANYSTTVTALKSIGEIQVILAAHGVKHILIDYANGEPISLSFIVDTPYGEMPFRLPAYIDRVNQLLQKELVSSSYKRWDTAYQEEKRNKIKEQASRVAWRIIKDWIRAQMAILETEMVTIDQIFLPYMQMQSGKILYEVMVDHHLQLPEGGKG